MSAPYPPNQQWGGQHAPMAPPGQGPGPRGRGQRHLPIAIVMGGWCLVAIVIALIDFSDLSELSTLVDQAEAAGQALPGWLPSPGAATLFLALVVAGAVGGIAAAALLALRKAPFAFVALGGGALASVFSVVLMVQFSDVPDVDGASGTGGFKYLTAGLVMLAVGIVGLIPKVRADLGIGSAPPAGQAPGPGFGRQAPPPQQWQPQGPPPQGPPPQGSPPQGQPPQQRW